jgi:hypothetical protein
LSGDRLFDGVTDQVVASLRRRPSETSGHSGDDLSQLTDDAHFQKSRTTIAPAFHVKKPPPPGLIRVL